MSSCLSVRLRVRPFVLSLIHISEPTRLLSISYAVFCLKKKKIFFFFFLMIRRPPRSTLDRSSAASDVYKRQLCIICHVFLPVCPFACSSVCPVSYTHLRAHETPEHLVCRLLLEKKKNFFFFFFNDTATTEIYTRSLVGSVRCV